jgi:hypothetical protein
MRQVEAVNTILGNAAVLEQVEVTAMPQPMSRNDFGISIRFRKLLNLIRSNTSLPFRAIGETLSDLL